MVAASILPYSQVFINTGDAIDREDLLEFRLLYEGELLASGNNGHPKAKHAIRRKLHPQLRRQWTLHSGLRQLAANAGNQAAANIARTEPEWFEIGIGAIGKQWARNGYEFIPLVTAEHAVRCSLDILLLRPGEKTLLFTQGDIDGQVKTLFDALRIPDSLKEAGDMGPQEDETPFYCLLSDDKLISEVRVNADELLLLPTERRVKSCDAFAVIHVRLNYKRPGVFDRYLD